MTIIEIGASFDPALASFVEYPCNTVYFVEPVPANVLALQNNLQLEFPDVRNYKVILGAVSDKIEVLPFYVAEDSNITHLASLSHVSSWKDRFCITTVTLSKLTSDLNIDKIDIMRLNTVGRELQILQEVRALNAEYLMINFFEAAYSKRDLCNRITDLGYEILFDSEPSDAKYNFLTTLGVGETRLLGTPNLINRKDIIAHDNKGFARNTPTPSR